MDVLKGISKFAQEQIDCIECKKQQKVLNDDIVKLKNFVNRYKPSVLDYMKSQSGYQQWKKDFEEWDNLMRL